MTVLVTGAAGHVGAALVRALLAEGRRVRALVRGDTRALAGLDVELVRGDVCDRASIVAAVADVDLVFHAAARISLRSRRDPDVHRVNVGGTAALVDACLAAGVRLVHVSSVHALDTRGQDVLHENLPLADRGVSPYERSKAAAEREVLRGVAAGLDAVIVSPAAVIGPYDFKPSQVGRLILDLYRGRLPALTGGGQSWVDVRDVAGGAIAAAERGRRGERYLLSGHPLAIASLADMVAAVAGVRRPRLVLPLGLLGAVAPAAESFSRLLGREPVLSPVSVDSLRGPLEMCHDKAARELGYTPRPLAETVTEAVIWLHEHHLGEAAPRNRSAARPANPRSAP